MKKDSPVYVYNRDGTQQSRDKQKELISQATGITLIVVPYWWRHSEEYLRSRVAEVRPDIYPTYKHISIGKPPKLKEFQSAYLPEKSKDLTQNMDPTGWWMFPKYKGARVFWNGERLVSSHSGERIELPPTLAMAMPPFGIEGQLWYGDYCEFT
jgi:hypothetical protein